MADSPLTRSARGQECTIRIPGVCNGNPETTVLCHINGAGAGIKAPDYEAAYGCSNCHAVVDGKAQIDFDKDCIKLWFLEACVRTRKIMQQKGLISYAGMKAEKQTLPRKY